MNHINSQIGAQTLTFNSLKKAFLAIVGLLVIFFIYEFVLRYFVWSEEAYGAHYWQYRVPLVFHVAGGLVALSAGVFQLWTGLNGSNMNVHPITGKIYVTGVALGSLGAFVLSIVSAVFGLTFGVALFSMALAWVSITSMAVYCIRKRNIQLHKQWMIRSYILTFAFVTFRIFTDYLPYEAWWGVSRAEMSNAIIWGVWVLPLIAYEIYVQSREV